MIFLKRILSNKRFQTTTILGAIFTFFLFLSIFSLRGFKKINNREKSQFTPRYNKVLFNNTIICPHLDVKVTDNNNIVWCATFQLAWNELCNLLGENAHFVNEPNYVEILNRKYISKDDLNENDYVIASGLANEEIINKIHNDINRKFGDKLEYNQNLTPKLSPIGVLFIFSFLFKELPFEWSFERLREPLIFENKKVESFGIDQFLTRQKNEVKAASQVLIYDFKDHNDFIIELKTKSQNDRLFLAKIKPENTLSETIAAVLNRISNNQHKEFPRLSSLIIPVIYFDLERDFVDLCNKPLITNNQLYNSKELYIAQQKITFKLDEKGAMLKSNALMVSGIAEDYVFDKPFLVMILRNG